MNVAIVSQRFNAGHFSHLAATYELVRERGDTPVLFIESNFSDMAEAAGMVYCNDLRSLRSQRPLAAAIFWFPCLRNIFYILLLRIYDRAVITYVFHEPVGSFCEFARAGFSLKQQMRVLTATAVSAFTCLLANRIVLPSKKAERSYRKRYAWLNRQYCVAPLIFTDECDMTKCPTRQFFSYIGTVAPDHAFERFMGFVIAACESDWLPGLKFAIATGSKLTPQQTAALSHPTISERVVVSSGKPLPNSAINAYFASSCVVWSLYRRSTQSGVIPKAYMFGTPVIAAKGITDEFVNDGNTGRVLACNCTDKEIISGIQDILSRQKHFEAASRQYFLDTFHYRNSTKTFLGLQSA